MSLIFTKNLSSPVEQELFKEEKIYKKAVKAEAEFFVLKRIRERIKMLKAELSEQKAHPRHSL